MCYGFITMNNKDVFFHVDNVRIGKDYSLKQGDEVSFILDEYDRGVIDVQLFPTLSIFTSTSETVAQVNELDEVEEDSSVPSRVTDTRGTVKSCGWTGGYVTPDGSSVDVPFRSDRLFGCKPGERAIFVLETDTLGEQRATEIYPIHDALSTTRLSNFDY